MSRTIEDAIIAYAVSTDAYSTYRRQRRAINLCRSTDSEAGHAAELAIRNEPIFN